MGQTDAIKAQEARRLLAEDRCDEDVERLTGLSLPEIVILRAETASSPGWRGWAAGAGPARRFP